MPALVGPDELKLLSPAGYYLALRIGFAYPVEEINALPEPWIDYYSRNGLMLFDPTVRWAYQHTGSVTWLELARDDPKGVLSAAASHGMRHGVTVSFFDNNADGHRSFGSFLRPDREFTQLEVDLLSVYVRRRHTEMAPPTNITQAELSALKMVKGGMRIKQVAFTLGITEGAVKQRLKKAKEKLGATTSTQAATLAAQHGLI